MKKTKKALLAAVFCSAALAAAFGLAACNKGDTEPETPPAPSHSHVWGNWTVDVDNEPTTERGGKATRTCSGSGECTADTEDKEYPLPVLNKTDYTTGEDSATCSATGTMQYTYNKDDVNVTITVATPINASAHKYGAYVNTDPAGHYQVCEYNSEHVSSKPSHNEEGEDGKCSVCGYKAEAPEAHSHVWGDWTVYVDNEPTTERGGKATRTCSGKGECDADTSAMEYPLPVLNETDYTVNVTKQATCAETGTTAYTYNADGVNVTITVTTPVDSDAHNWSAWAVEDDNKPTADGAGKATRTCNNDGCGATVADKEYPLPELNETDYTAGEDSATCTKPGTVQYTYNKDGVNVSFTVDTPASHKLTHYDAVPAAGCVSGNIEYWSCSVCKNKYGDEECTNKLAANGEIDWATTKHAGSAWDMKHEVAMVAPTCTTDGSKGYYTCDTCDGKFISSNYADVTGNVACLPASEDELKFPAGHGWKVNGSTYEKKNIATTNAKAATCTADGYSQTYYKCNVSGCGKFFSDAAMTQELTAAEVAAIKIPKLGHVEPEHFDAEPATCLSTGLAESWYCSQCNKYFTNEAMTSGSSATRAITPMHPDATELTITSETVTTLGNKTISFAGYSSFKMYECAECGDYYYYCGTYREFAVTATKYNSTHGYLVGVGKSSVASGSTSTSVTFRAPSDGIYTFVLSNGKNAAASTAEDKSPVNATPKITALKYWASETSYTSPYSNSRWATSGTGVNHKTKFVQNGTTLEKTFTVEMKEGEIIGLTANTKYYDVEIIKQLKMYPELEAGSGSVEITEADVWKDVYTFTFEVEEDVTVTDPDAISVKTFKLTVPEGVSVGVVYADYDYTNTEVDRVIISGNNLSSYISVVAGQKVYLVFKSATVGEKAITLVEDDSAEGEKLSLGVSLHRLELAPRTQDDEGNVSGGVMTYVVGTIPEGRYTLTFTLNQSMGRTTVYIGKNTSEDWSDYYTAAGNTKDDNVADLRLSQMTLSVYDNEKIYDAALDGYKLTVTLDLKAGDKVVIALGDPKPCILEGLSLSSAAE